MTVHPIRVKLKYQDYLQFPDDLKRHEVAGGEHHASPPPIPYHQVLVVRLSAQLQVQIDARGLGLVLPAPLCVHLGEHDVFEPDITVLLRDRQHLLTPKKIKGAPSLLIEVLSPATRKYDTSIKRARYAIHAVPEYWIVDPDEHVVEQLVLEGSEYRLHGTFGDSIQPIALPDVSVDLKKVW